MRFLINPSYSSQIGLKLCPLGPLKPAVPMDPKMDWSKKVCICTLQWFVTMTTLEQIWT